MARAVLAISAVLFILHLANRTSTRQGKTNKARGFTYGTDYERNGKGDGDGLKQKKNHTLMATRDKS